MKILGEGGRGRGKNSAETSPILHDEELEVPTVTCNYFMRFNVCNQILLQIKNTKRNIANNNNNNKESKLLDLSAYKLCSFFAAHSTQENCLVIRV